MSSISRRGMLASTSALVLLGAKGAGAQAPAAGSAGPARAAQDSDWLHYASDLASTRYAPLDQINAGNFDRLEVAWRFDTNSYGPQRDAYYNATPLVVKGRLYTTAGTARHAVALDATNGQVLWTYSHNERGRTGTRAGAGFGLSYWSEGDDERILYVTRSYQLVCLDAKTGRPVPSFGTDGEVDLRQDWDQEVDPVRAVAGLHSPVLVVNDTLVVGTAAGFGSPSVQAFLRGYDARTGKRKWIFHTIPRKGQYGYESWSQEGQAEKATAVGVWAPMSADPELGLIYAGVELPATDVLGTGRIGNALFSESLVALDAETGAVGDD